MNRNFASLLSRTLTIQAAIVSVSVFGCINTVDAQVSLSPLYAKLAPSPSGQTQTTFIVTNGSNSAIRFRAAFDYFTFDERTIKIIEPDANTESNLSTYLRAAPLEFEVPAYSEQIIRVIALVPPNVLSNELRAALILEPLDSVGATIESESGKITGQFSFDYRFVAQLYMSPVNSPSFKIERVSQAADGNLQVVVSNDSVSSGISNITWEVSHQNEKVASSETSERFVVLANSERTRSLGEGAIQLPPGKYVMTGTLGLDDGGEPPVVLNPQPFTKTFTVK